MKKIFASRKVRIYLLTGLLLVSSFGFFAFRDRDFEVIKNLDIFYNLFDEVILYYVDEKEPEELIHSSIKGMLESLDPYTTFIPESEIEDFRFTTTGQYGGIGALIRRAGKYCIIAEPYQGFPAEEAGLMAGDTLYAVDGISTWEKAVGNVSDLLKGKPHTPLTLTIKRNDSPSFEVELERAQITIPNVPYFGMLENETGYIRLTGFTPDAHKEVKQAFQSLKSQGAKSMILDVRGNPGGILLESVEIANLFVNKGAEIVSTKGRIEQWNKVHLASKHPIDTIIPLAVLVNRGSASAAEIVAGSLQDLDRAVVIGERTFGKGLVQVPRKLSYKTELKITSAKYYIPSGRCIQALDYTHRNEDGSVGHIPDSLISEFKTKNGRIVTDGGGILPDITVESERPANITFSLYANNLIFDFATIFNRSNDSIAPAYEFEINEAIYDEFIVFLEDKEIKYNSSSNEKLEELIKIAKREGYFSIAEEEIDILRDKLQADSDKDLIRFDDEIKQVLRDEICSRYYYQKGRIISSLRDDPQLEKALEILSHKEELHSILYSPHEVGDLEFALDR